MDAVSAEASQNPMYRRQNEQVLKFAEELNGWQLPAITGHSVQTAPMVFGCTCTLPKSSVVSALSLNARLRPEEQHNSRCNIRSTDR